MDVAMIRNGVFALSKFVRAFCEDGKVRSHDDFKRWTRDPANVKLMRQTFGYDNDAWPDIRALVSPAFHHKHPLVLLNYTPVAHNTLHAVPDAWTPALRLCRGTVFERTGRLISLAFEKFFNVGEHPETMLDALPDEAYVATEKMDGHLAIIFKYANEFIMTTRGRFDSPSAILGNKKLRPLVRRFHWDKEPRLDFLTLLCEFIDQTTHVHVSYDKKDFGFVLIAVKNTASCEELEREDAEKLAERLGLRMSPVWRGTLSELMQSLTDRGIRNKEGQVVRFAGGLRVKMKYQTYIGEMVKAKLSFNYLMNRYLSGNMEKMLLTLDEEIYNIALQMLGQMFLRVSTPGTLREKWQRLYGLVDEDDQTSYFKDSCRKFVKQMHAAND